VSWEEALEIWRDPTNFKRALEEWERASPMTVREIYRRWRIPIIKPIAIRVRTATIKISSEELKRIYQVYAEYTPLILTESVGDKAEELLKLIDEKLREEGLKVSEEVKLVIANFLALLGKKIDEVNI